MTLFRAIAASALLAASSPLVAQAPAPPAPAATPVPVDYSNPANWLCLPGREDPCAQPLPTAALNPNDYGPVVASRPAADPKIDCFYVYPTVSRDPGDNSDLQAGEEERSAAYVQFARYSTLCKTYAPIYRQATLALLQRALAGGDRPALDRAFGLAYRDVRNAWLHYLAQDNKGRPFVLVGHSQGSILLSLLIAREIENAPAASRMLSAVLAGVVVEVPQGKTVGGSFKKTPLCTRAGESGCVLAWASFRAESPPPEGSLFGRAAGPGMTAACTNPAALAGGEAPLDSIWFAGRGGGAITWSTAGPPPAPFLTTHGLVSARCVHDGAVGYLAVRVNADPKDKRTDQIPGDVVVFGGPLPGWGLHLADTNLAMGDVLRLVAAQRDSFLSGRH